MSLGTFARRNAARTLANPEFTQAVLVFRDGSHIRFEHTSRQNRWARASAEGTTADTVCLALAQFRLNRKHLQLFFKDGTEVEFQPTEDTNGATVGQA